MTPFRIASLAIGALLLLLASSPEVSAIMRRHDVPDADYIVPASDYPAIVDLLSPGDCLAMLIEGRWLLTAAHCAALIPEAHSVDLDGVEQSIEGVVCHPDYEGFGHDVALIRLSEDVTNVTPLPLYRAADEIDQTVLFIGRGDHGTGRQGQIDASNDGATRLATNTVRDVSAKWLEFVFARPDDADVTPMEGISGDGDSGGPALIETASGAHIAGLSSWQDARRRKVGTYGVHDYYTRVSSYLEFIDETTGADWDGEYRSCPPECGCRAAGAGSTRSPMVPASLALACGILGWRRRSRPPR